jgi:hypothetical protein
MSIVVAIASEPFEYTPWTKRCANIHAFAKGPGPRLAQAALQQAEAELGKIDVLLSIGLCGALAPEFELYDIVCATAVNDWPAQPLDGAKSARLLSIDRFLGGMDEKKAAHAQGYGIVEMEAAPLAQWAAETNTRFHAVKVVSDLATEAFALDFNQHRDADGRFRKTSIAFAGLRHPRDLYRMASRAGAASAKLGEFLSKYEF